jgi:hypothetical protein
MQEVIEFAKPILESIPKNFETVDELKKYSADNQLEERLEQHPLIVDTAIIKSSNGLDYRIIVPMKFQISGLDVESNATIANRTNLNYKLILGEKDLKKFLIDPSKKLILKLKN